ncbi:hypothetical protein BJV82DRAFT_216345 [Fennellomyces sp. T-0311]|nr:hypothetical protein BJV82DRAFT_216345 [Fennellomyces sp. T-0311]
MKSLTLCRRRSIIRYSTWRKFCMDQVMMQACFSTHSFLNWIFRCREHLQNHDVQVEFVYTPPKRSSDNGTNGSGEQRVLDDASGTKDSNEGDKTTTNVPVVGSENNSKIILHNPSTDSEDPQDKRRCTDTIEHPELKRQRVTDMKAHQMDHDTAVLASSDGLFTNDRERRLRLAIA